MHLQRSQSSLSVAWHICGQKVMFSNKILQRFCRSGWRGELSMKKVPVTGTPYSFIWLCVTIIHSKAFEENSFFPGFMHCCSIKCSICSCHVQTSHHMPDPRAFEEVFTGFMRCCSIRYSIFSCFVQPFIISQTPSPWGTPVFAGFIVSK